MLLANLTPFVLDHCLFVVRFQLEVMLEDNLALPSNGRLYSKVLNWVQHSLWENGENLEQLMEEVSTRLLESSPSSCCHPSPLPSHCCSFLSLTSRELDPRCRHGTVRLFFFFFPFVFC